MKRRDLWLILALLLIAAAVFFYVRSLTPATSHANAKEGLGEATLEYEPLAYSLFETAYAEEGPVNKSPSLYGFEEASSYLCIWLGEQFQIVPLNKEGTLHLRQTDDIENVIAIGKDCFHMASSTCENQNCVQQGEVTLDNKDDRALFNWVVCLPNKVMLEMLTPDEVVELMENTQATDAQG